MDDVTMTDRIIVWIKDYRVAAVIIVFAIIITGVAKVLTSVDQIWTFGEKRLGWLSKKSFEATEEYTQQRFTPSSKQYFSPAPTGRVIFDYSNNDGKFSIGSGPYMFETQWSKASDQRIHVYNDPPSIHAVALVKDAQEISAIDDAQRYDGSSRARTPSLGQIVVIQNTNGFFAALKILAIEDDTRGSPSDKLTFEYVIQTNGTPDFTNGGSS